MHPVLHTAFLSCSAELDAVDTTTAQLHPEGKPNVLSIQQQVDQLVASIRASSDLLERRLRRGRLPRTIMRTRLEWALQLMILGFGFVPGNMPLTEYYGGRKSNQVLYNGKELAKRLGDELAALDELVNRCRAEFGMERFEHHPLLGPMRADQWRRCHVLQLRILTQSIAAARKSLASPVKHSAQQTARVA
jgi:hypothetical protein